MPRAQSLAPVRCSANADVRRSSPRRIRPLGSSDVATIHPQQLSIGVRPDLVARLQRRSLRVLMRGDQEACHSPWTCDAPATPERIRNGFRQDTPGGGELARGIELTAAAVASYSRFSDRPTAA